MLTPIIDLLGEDRLSWFGGLLVGGLFGFFGQRSRFCLRAAAVEFSRGEGGPRLAEKKDEGRAKRFDGLKRGDLGAFCHAAIS